MRYQAGEEVKVREDLELHKNYGKFCASSGMVALAGQRVHIGCVNAHDESYFVDEDPFMLHWTDEMFEPAEAPTADDNPYWANITKVAQSQRRKGLETYGHPLEDFQTPDAKERIRYIEEELVDALMYLEWLRDRK